MFVNNEELTYKIGISLIPGIGPVTAKKLIAYSGSIEGVFKQSRKSLLKIPGIGERLSKNILEKSILDRAEKEKEFIKEFKIKSFFYLDKDYPERLKHCEDAPVMIFQKGKGDLNSSKAISIVGTRNATQTGKEICNKFVEDVSKKHPDTIIISGLAYGIDITAHKAALKNGLKTAAVLGHGLKTLYPSAHRQVAKKIIEQGALVTDFLSHELPERNNFVKRNRIIAGLSDATIVVESGLKGGALITADIANSYNRDVFAFPGRIHDPYSKGCNRLIISHKAALIESVEDLEYIMGWEAKEQKSTGVQKELFIDLEENEKKVVDLLSKHKDLTLDQISLKLNSPVSQVSSQLLGLEFKGLVKSLPGKLYKLYS